MQDISVLISLKDQFTSKLNASKKALQNYQKEIMNSNTQLKSLEQQLARLERK